MSDGRDSRRILEHAARVPRGGLVRLLNRVDAADDDEFQLRLLYLGGHALVRTLWRDEAVDNVMRVYVDICPAPRAHACRRLMERAYAMGVDRCVAQRVAHHHPDLLRATRLVGDAVTASQIDDRRMPRRTR